MIIMSKELSQSYLKSIIFYNPDNGEFRWIKDTKNHKKPGSLAGSINKGYRRIRIDGRMYAAHRLAIFYVTGVWACGQVDHINQNRSDNSFSNLRIVSNSENSRNQKIRKTNKSGFNGVAFCSTRGKWGACIRSNGRTVGLGYYENINDAINARKKANSIYGYHKNHGKSA